MLDTIVTWQTAIHGSIIYVIPICAYLVLAAVAINFAMARRVSSGDTRKPGPVATVTMLLFFLGLYELIHWKVGVWHFTDPTLLLVVEAFGLALVVMGAAVNVAGRFSLGSNWANQATVYRDQRLVTTGLYRLLRHPLYASLIWMGVGASLAYLNWAGILATLLVFRTMMAQRAEVEERMLVERFPEYSDYAHRTGRFFPKLWRGDALIGFQPVEVPRNAFAFCRWSMALLIWVGVVWHVQWLLAACAAVMALSAALTVKRAPMVMLYSWTVERLWPSEKVVLDATGLRLAHVVAVLGIGIPLAFLQWGPEASWLGAWRVMFVIALAKTAGAMGFCAVSRLFTCALSGGSCCRFLKLRGA